jgi:hypothetical protein
MNFSRSIFLVVALLSWPCIGQAQPSKELYELQERCAKQADELYQGTHKRWSQTSAVSFNFEHHCSLRLNKCFYLLINDSKPPNPNFKSMFLHDLNDNTQYYGEYVKHSSILLGCRVRSKQCRSEEEWRELIKPFMED